MTDINDSVMTASMATLDVSIYPKGDNGDTFTPKIKDKAINFQNDRTGEMLWDEYIDIKGDYTTIKIGNMYIGEYTEEGKTITITQFNLKLREDSSQPGIAFIDCYYPANTINEKVTGSSLNFYAPTDDPITENKLVISTIDQTDGTNAAEWITQEDLIGQGKIQGKLTAGDYINITDQTIKTILHGGASEAESGHNDIYTDSTTGEINTRIALHHIYSGTDQSTQVGEDGDLYILIEE